VHDPPAARPALAAPRQVPSWVVIPATEHDLLDQVALPKPTAVRAPGRELMPVHEIVEEYADLEGDHGPA